MSDIMDKELKDTEDNIEIEQEDDSVLPLMNKPFDPSQINIETKTPSLDTLIKRIVNNEIEMNTESYFQRKDDLWDITKQSRLIESILIRFPLPAFFFDATNDNRWLVVDGLQRLSSIRNFVVKKTLKLTNLEFLIHLNGYKWDDLSRDLQRIIEESQIVTYKILPGTPNDVKFNIFKRINTGGLTLEPQEIRHALYQGAPAKLVASLAALPMFGKATGYKISNTRMLDRDFATRFLAFYYLGVSKYAPDLDSFMNQGMSSVYSLSENEIVSIKEAFNRSLRRNYKIFGNKAFRKISMENRRGPINKALFDVFSVVFAKMNSTKADYIVQHSEQFIEKYKELLNSDEAFVASITSSTSDKGRVNYRFQRINDLIVEFTEY